MVAGGHGEARPRESGERGDEVAVVRPEPLLLAELDEAARAREAQALPEEPWAPSTRPTRGWTEKGAFPMLRRNGPEDERALGLAEPEGHEPPSASR